jgi:hypothetical protein
MSNVAQVSEAMQQVLTVFASAIEREVGFVERSSAKLDGSTFAQMTVFCWLHTPDASYSMQRHVAATLGVHVTAQAVEQRFGEGSVALMQRLFEESVRQVILSEPQTEGEQGKAEIADVLTHFNGVYLQDGSVISLPPDLAAHWPGCGGKTPEAGVSSLRMQVRLELAQGRLQGPWLQAGREAERSGEAVETPLPEGCLYVVDLGYFTLAGMRRHSEQGHFWLCPAKANVKVYDQRGQCWDVLDLLEAQHLDSVDLPVRLGKRDRVTARLIAVRHPVAVKSAATVRTSSAAKGCQPPNVKRASKDGKGHKRVKKATVSSARQRLADWTILISNVPEERMSVNEALVLMRARWQIELLWKQWKQHGKVDTWRSRKSSRILTEVYAKLLGCLITHWLTLLGCWRDPHRSLVKARQVVQWMAPCIALSFAGTLTTPVVVAQTAEVMSRGCTLAKRGKGPNSAQLLASPELVRA